MVVVVVQMSDSTSACLTGYGKNRRRQIQGGNFFLCFKLMLRRIYFWFHLTNLHFAPEERTYWQKLSLFHCHSRNFLVTYVSDPPALQSGICDEDVTIIMSIYLLRIFVLLFCTNILIWKHLPVYGTLPNCPSFCYFLFLFYWFSVCLLPRAAIPFSVYRQLDRLYVISTRVDFEITRPLS